MVKYYTHVNRHVIDKNRKEGTSDPAITIKRGKSGKPSYASRVSLPAGAEMVCSSHYPILSCVARLVIISDEPPTILE